jgi:hypothetical protein
VILYVLLTHRPAREVAESLDDFERVLPGRRCVVCFGGTREDFEGLRDNPDALFIEDPALRRRAGQSYNAVLALVWERLIAPDSTFSHIHLMEYDHVVLSPRYEAELLGIMAGERVGLLAPSCADHTSVNWPHAIDLLDDPEFERKLDEISTRDQENPSIWGGLGNGMTIRRDALEDFCRAAADLPRYMEAWVPSAVWHLGYRVTGAPGDAALFDHVRFGPPYEREEAVRLAREGALALHPLKERAAQRDAVLAADESRRLVTTTRDETPGYDRDDAHSRSP